MRVISTDKHLLWGAYCHSRKRDLVSNDERFAIEEPDKLTEGVDVEVQYFSRAAPRSYWMPADNVAGFVKEGFIDRLILSEDVCLSKQIKYRARKNCGDLLKI